MLAIALFVASAVNAQKPKLAVMDFIAGVGLYQKDVNGLSDMLINSLFNTGKFELIERGQLCQLIGETNLQKSSLSAGQLQELAIKGVNFLLLGTVNLTGGEYNIDVRVVDVGTGQLYTTADTTKLAGQTYRDMMPKLANSLAAKLPQTVKATVTTQSQPYVIINGVKWAKQNVGANSPTEYGNYYTFEQAKNACPSGWRLPTKQEFESLLSAGSVWTTQNGVSGRLFGKVPNQIFLPAAGYRYDSDGALDGAGEYGYYWSSTPRDSGLAYYLHFISGDASTGSTNRRRGFSVRPVAE
ncbi:MAG: hypothetical protein LBN23_02930 [Paludibacter sp.]|nr:hypothetical protein [Paludibacter sp.]